MPCKGRLEGASVASLTTWPMSTFPVFHSPLFSLFFVVLCSPQSLLSGPQKPALNDLLACLPLPGRSRDALWELCHRKRGTDSWLLLLLPTLGASTWSDLISLFSLIKTLLQPCLCPLGALSICRLPAEGQRHCFVGGIRWGHRGSIHHS